MPARVDRETVRAANRLEDVIPALTGHPISRNGGREFWTKCPLHEDQHDSLRIDPDKQVWFCDPCQVGGDVFRFVEAFRGSDFRAALAELAARAGLPPARAAGAPSRIVAAFPYHALDDGHLLYQSCRKEPGANGRRKTFTQRRPDGHGGWIYNLDGVVPVLYRLPQLRGKKAIFVVEGEGKADRLWSLNLPATTNVGGAGKWQDRYATCLRELGVERVAILPDHDASGQQHAEAVARSCAAAGLVVKMIVLPNLPPKGDVINWLDAGHTGDQLTALAKTTPVYEAPPVPVPAPDTPAAVAAAAITTAPETSGGGKRSKKKQPAGRSLQLDDPDPWPEAVAGETLLSAIAALLRTFVVFAQPAYADVLALWIAHTYLMDVWWISPLVVANSPTMRCGKTTLLQLVAHLASRPLPASNIRACQTIID